MDCWSPTIDLLPPSIRIDVLLLTSVRNAAQLRKALMESDPRLENIALIKAHLIIDPLQVHVAANKSIMADSRDKKNTRSLSTEVIFNLSSTKNITASLQTFGIGDDDQNLIAVIFDDIASISSESDRNERKNKFLDLVDGSVSTNMEDLSEITDLDAITKAHKLKHLAGDRDKLTRLLISRSAAKDLIF
ncbi:hypothetical protein TCAL_03413 [Tigriopus californicus]|uniref:EKC/KEOPS complex subunit CGI121 n=2 Tax=Tigriopus californicus TaxID=6832 RepID=A0A553P1Y1_TIGCA|nr:EKC/KEOPS complex subunit Tprkb-like isoform X2 [Tigriopus californicus]TRY71689.1 hypothetical protein TCAL_03413 [Tigriopus californicus]|eukprot:TCALIF_03413-PA protein Name:"Similar to Tprkb EKC/KEOPS complex subunit Tprkb (Mus musculus)" AED:0.00 eAED:0.00 QI:70/1/1/1/1/1/2/31/189